MGLVLDTSVLVPSPRHRIDLPATLRDYGELPVGIAAVTAAELLRAAPGGLLGGSVASYAEQLVLTIPVLPFDVFAAREYARLWGDVESDPGQASANPHDLLVAATALSRNWALLTLTPGRYEGLEGLVLAPRPRPAPR